MWTKFCQKFRIEEQFQFGKVVFFRHIYFKYQKIIQKMKGSKEFKNRWTSWDLKRDLLAPKTWLTLHKKWSFPLRFLQWMWPNPQFLANLVTFTEEILNGKLHFWCSVMKEMETKELEGNQTSQSPQTGKPLWTWFIFMYSGWCNCTGDVLLIQSLWKKRNFVFSSQRYDSSSIRLLSLSKGLPLM